MRRLIISTIVAALLTTFGAIARTSGLDHERALAGSTIDAASCNPRDPLSPCFQERVNGIPVGDVVVVEDFF